MAFYLGSDPQIITDLNKARISTADLPNGYVQDDFGIHSEDFQTRVYFKDIETHLVHFIGQAEVVVGCVAWVTSIRVLDALARISGASIIIQKEDFLRPDTGQGGDWALKLRYAYRRVRGLTRYELPYPICGLDTLGDPTIEAVRCVGIRNGGQSGPSPRSHHKFIVACNWNHGDAIGGSGLKPYAVWTGSYNFTNNSAKSFENAVVIFDQTIVDSFVNEWAQIAALSEPLDWESEWVAPEWRIGT